MSLRLQHLQWIAGFAIALCCLALGGMSFRSSLDSYSRTTTGVETFGRFRLVLNAMNAVSFERGPAQQLMAWPLGDEVARAKTAEARKTTDAQLASAEGALRGGTLADAELLKGIDSIRARLAHARGLVDALAQVELRERGAASVKSAIEAMFGAFDGAEDVRDRLGHRVVRLAPEIASEVFLCLLSSGLREQAGRLGAYIVMVLKAGNKADPDAAREVIFTVGRLKALQRALASLSASIEPEGELLTAIAEVNKRFFGQSLPWVLAAAKGSVQDSAMSVTDFTRSYQNDLRASHDLREVAARVSYAKLERMQAAAFRDVMMSGGLMLFVFVTMVLVAHVFRRSLFQPLLEAHAQIVAIADGDLSEPKAARKVGPEIREMLAGLDTLREEQRFRRQLEEDQRRMARQLKLLSETDMLTGLLNRRALEDEAARAFAAASAAGHAVGVILFDIDHFKAINDTFGHAVGDAVLQAIASELRSVLRPDAAFARFGGEEFLVLLPICESEEAVRVADALHQRLDKIAVRSAPGIRITASFGVAVSEPGRRLSWDALLGNADRRLYAAKREGRNRVFADDRRVLVTDAA